MVERDNTSGASPSAWKVWLGEGLGLLFHGAMVLSIGLLSLFIVFDVHTLLECINLVRSGVWQPSFLSVALHFGLAAFFWGSCVWMFHYWQHRRHQQHERSIQPKRGSVMLETLIVLFPFLLLTSGLAQLTINNIGQVLVEYAAFQGARTAWLWEPEIEIDRMPSGTDNIDEQEVRRRARLAAASAMAPSAPGDFYIDDGNSHSVLKNHRRSMMATFSKGLQRQGQSADAASALGLGRGGGTSTHTFAKAFDSESLRNRAPRKLTYAYLAFSDFQLINTDNEVGVDFDYEMQQVFPWFSYIHGDHETDVGGRDGFFVTLERESTLEPQVRIRRR